MSNELANTILIQFVTSRGNEYFCDIDEEYLTDRFNLTGLNTEVQYYQYALDLITDVFDLDCDDEMREAIERSARHLYGLVHARYIITTRGQHKMVSQLHYSALFSTQAQKANMLVTDGKVQKRRLRQVSSRSLPRPKPLTLRPTRHRRLLNRSPLLRTLRRHILSKIKSTRLHRRSILRLIIRTHVLPDISESTTTQDQQEVRAESVWLPSSCSGSIGEVADGAEREIDE